MSEQAVNTFFSFLSALEKAARLVDEKAAADALMPFANLPGMAIGPAGIRAVTNEEEYRAGMIRSMAAARQVGYKRSEVLDLETEDLGPDLCSIRGVFVRRNSLNEEIQALGRAAFIHVWRRTESGWKLVLELLYSPHGSVPE